MSAAGRPYRVVVGMDTSAGAVAALEWAAEHVSLRRGELVVVHATDPYSTRAPYASAATGDAEHEAARREVDRIISTVLDRIAEQTSVRAAVHRRYVVDLPARALAAACVDADLLVMGTDPHPWGPDGVGATARACLQHPICPTIVVPATRVTPPVRQLVAAR